jgi:hypothetical protein
MRANARCAVELSELSAREGIRDLVARYNSNGDAGRFPQLLDLFTPTAVMEIPDETGATHRYEGRDAIMSMFSSLKVGFDEALGPEDSPHLIRHYTATHQIDLLDDHHARGRLYYAVLMVHVRRNGRSLAVQFSSSNRGRTEPGLVPFWRW